VRFNFFDLATNERLTPSEEFKFKTVRNCFDVFQSIQNLHIVIHQLSTKQNFVPYRDSLLTRFLQDSFSGGTKTTIVTCLD
jgi:hypothetical protein